MTDVLHLIAQSVEASSSLCGHCIFDEKGSRDHSRDGAERGPLIVRVAGVRGDRVRGDKFHSVTRVALRMDRSCETI